MTGAFLGELDYFHVSSWRTSLWGESVPLAVCLQVTVLYAKDAHTRATKQ